MLIRVGHLISPKVTEKWQSTKYWDVVDGAWLDVKQGSVCLVVDVRPEAVVFMHRGRMFSIHNCYYDANGYPIWCDIL